MRSIPAPAGVTVNDSRSSAYVGASMFKGLDTPEKVLGLVTPASDHWANTRWASTPVDCGEGNLALWVEPCANHARHGAVHGTVSISRASPVGTVFRTCSYSSAVCAVNTTGPWMLTKERGFAVLASVHRTNTRCVCAAMGTVWNSEEWVDPWSHQGERHGVVHTIPSTRSG